MATKGGETKRRKRRTWLMPQEVEVWYVLPSIRRELARVMIEKGKPQKQIAKMLGVTEPAVTQYKLNKSNRSRGDQVKISKEVKPEIEKSAAISHSKNRPEMSGRYPGSAKVRQ